MCILDRLHGMNDVIGQKPLTATSPPIADFDAADEDR
jgi:hypothetical protein